MRRTLPTQRMSADSPASPDAKGTQEALDAPLHSLPRRAPLACAAATPLADALPAMHGQGVGSVLVLDEAGAAAGILTRHDLLGRVLLPQRPLSTPLGAVMSTPVHTLDEHRTLLDAALLMAQQGIRHVPVTAAGRVVNIVSERDLFALQRLSFKGLATQLRAAPDLPALQAGAADIRALAAQLLAQGVHARALTALISLLNDTLTARLVALVAAKHGLDLQQACWLAFGSEGRGEQTIATDQDNGLVFASAAPEADRPRWLAMAQEVNLGLDACGYPLCRGGVMAGNPACCLSAAEWAQRFEHWIEQGAPEDLLQASIYFDLRPLCGNFALAQPLQALPARLAQRTPRFLKQLAQNALRQRPPLNWHGGLHTEEHAGQAVFDLKHQGTAVFVDVARLYALAHGVAETGTRQRLQAAAQALQVAEHEGHAWLSAFDFLQGLRLRVQAAAAGPATQAGASANFVALAALDDIEHRTLKEAARAARRLLQRLALDYER
jgi:CBS domain-containing protein